MEFRPVPRPRLSCGRHDPRFQIRHSLPVHSLHLVLRSQIHRIDQHARQGQFGDLRIPCLSHGAVIDGRSSLSVGSARREGRRGNGVPSRTAEADHEAGAGTAFLYNAWFRVRGAGDGVLFFVMVDHAMYARGVDGTEHALELVMVDEDPPGVLWFERFAEVGEGWEVGEGDEVGGGDICVLEERGVFGP